MQALSLRDATVTDVEVIAAYNAAMARETENLGLDEGRVSAGVRAVLEDPTKGFYLVACHGARIVGQLMVTYEWSDWRNGVFWWIQSVYVHPDARGQGTFRALYEHLLGRAQVTAGVCGIRLYVERANLRAQAIYERLGMARTHYDMYELDFVLTRGARG